MTLPSGVLSHRVRTVSNVEIDVTEDDVIRWYKPKFLCTHPHIYTRMQGRRESRST